MSGSKRPRKSEPAPPQGERAWKKVKLDFTEMVLVKTAAHAEDGDDHKRHEKEILVHKDIITRRSPFFAAACDEKWDRKKPIDMTHHQSTTLETYLQCLYQDTIVGMTNEQDNFELLVHLYMLADEIADLWTANKVIDAIIQELDAQDILPSAVWIKYIYEWTHAESPLRRLLVDYYVFEGAPDIFDNDDEDHPVLPREFLTACLNKFATVKTTSEAFTVMGVAARRPCNQETGHYHEHHEPDHIYCCLRMDNETKGSGGSNAKMPDKIENGRSQGALDHV